MHSQVDILLLLTGGGFVAGIVNTIAGGGSMLTVPLLVLAGLPGTLANGTNRVGVLVQNLSAIRRFHAEGIEALRPALPVLVPVGIGSLVGALGISQVADATFERAFGLVMLALLAPTLRRPRPRAGAQDDPGMHGWPPLLRAAVFFAIGVYGGAFQAGVGIVLLLALGRAGFDLVTANAIKVIVVGLLTLVAVPVFVVQGQVHWLPATALALGAGAGGAVGAHLTVRSGERLVRPVLALAVAALAGLMLGLY